MRQREVAFLYLSVNCILRGESYTTLSLHSFHTLYYVFSVMFLETSLCLFSIITVWEEILKSSKGQQLNICKSLCVLENEIHDSVKLLSTVSLSVFDLPSSSFKVCGPGAEDRQARQTRAFQRRHSVLQRHCWLHHHLSSQWAHRGGRLTQWPLHTLWCYHWAAWCLQGECWGTCIYQCAVSIINA